MNTHEVQGRVRIGEGLYFNVIRYTAIQGML